jgi:flagellar motor switch protein FliN/FliY
MMQDTAGPAIELGAIDAGFALDPDPVEAVVAADAASALATSLVDELAPVLDVPVELTVEIGRTTMTIGETLTIGPGSIIGLKRNTGEPVDLLVNGKRIARGEVIAIDEEFGFRVTEVEPAESRLDAGL